MAVTSSVIRIGVGAHCISALFVSTTNGQHDIAERLIVDAKLLLGYKSKGANRCIQRMIVLETALYLRG